MSDQTSNASQYIRSNNQIQVNMSDQTNNTSQNIRSNNQIQVNMSDQQAIQVKISDLTSKYNIR